MRAIILSAVPASVGLAAVLHAELARAGFENGVFFDLTTTRLAFCQGEFDCWVKTPGRCRSEDGEADILAAAHDADALLFVGPLTFGGYDSVLKRAVDRLLSLLEPFFTMRLSLTHHALRYDTHQSLFSIALAPAAPAGLAATFAELNDANAINYLSPRCGSLILDEAHPEGWAAALAELFAHPRIPGAAIEARAPLTQALVAAAAPDAAPGPRQVRRAALLVGSPKPKGTSASEALARALAERLSRAQVTPELHFATTFVHDDQRAFAAAESIASCDLFVLVTPLYVDSFPSLATHALELVARARSAGAVPARFVTLVNCGFPEPEQNRTALRIARHFAAQAGYGWGGGLPLGGGGVVQPDHKLDEPHGPVAHVVRALDLAAPGLAATGIVPRAALDAIMHPVLSDWIYRTIGDLGWRWQAHEHGLAQRDLHARPLAPPTRRV